MIWIPFSKLSDSETHTFLEIGNMYPDPDPNTLLFCLFGPPATGALELGLIIDNLSEHNT
jgi:hypothetical protein